MSKLKEHTLFEMSKISQTTIASIKRYASRERVGRTERTGQSKTNENRGGRW